MKKLLLAASAFALTAGAAAAEDVKIGTLLGATGPIESIAPNMFTTVDLVVKEVNDSGKAANGWVFQNVRADSTCIGHGT